MSLRNRNQYPTSIRQEFNNLDRRLHRVAHANSYVPIGARIKYTGQVAPEGWMFSDGSQISRAKYAALFRVIGVEDGAGDGTSSFNLPTVADEIIFTGVA